MTNVTQKIHLAFLKLEIQETSIPVEKSNRNIVFCMLSHPCPSIEVPKTETQILLSCEVRFRLCKFSKTGPGPSTSEILPEAAENVKYKQEGGAEMHNNSLLIILEMG